MYCRDYLQAVNSRIDVFDNYSLAFIRKVSRTLIFTGFQRQNIFSRKPKNVLICLWDFDFFANQSVLTEPRYPRTAEAGDLRDLQD